MKFLVTGASGFLGRHLCKKLIAEGHSVSALDSKSADLLKPGSLSTFNHQTYDYIFHLAVWVQAGDFPKKHPADIWIHNQKMNTNILEWWKNFQPQAKFVAMGTSCAYAPGTDLQEKDYLKGIPHDSLLTYAMTKRMLYVGMQSLHSQYHLNYLSFAFSALYGEDYDTKGKQCHFIIDLIRKIIAAKEGKEKAVLWGDGHQKRELLFVDDLVNIILKLTPERSNELINVSCGQEYSIRTFAKLICDEVGYDPNLIEYDTSRYVGARSKCLNNEQLKSIMPDLEFTSLEEGLKKTIQCYLKRQNVSVL